MGVKKAIVIIAGFSLYYCNHFGYLKNHIFFWNIFGKLQPIRTKFGIYMHRSRGDNVQGILGALVKWRQNGGSDRVFCPVDSLPNG